MLDELLNAGSLPALERLVQFTEARHRVLTDNVANLSTPYFKPQELSPRSFQKTLSEALERRRSSGNSTSSPLVMQDSDQLTFTDDGMQAKPENANQGILFHDQNNRDLDRMMQQLAENTITHRVATDLIRTEYHILQVAIRERL